MAEPIYRIVPDEKGVRAIPPVERQRLLSPTEREEARRKREEARRKHEARTDGRPVKNPSQGRGGGVDYSA